ncbi:choice-of-anchor L domain-containing protein [Sinomonas halotolerans]|uniref:Choice-of-anchor L domain-containing protein n=1 Tax=Sinomonas halotolerans TaxID=1644133 RepID=A0ABU9WV38_9MICC
MHQHALRRAAVACAAAALTLTALPAHAVTSTTDLTTLTAGDLAATLLGPGITAANIVYTGAPGASGTFAGGATTVGFDTGVILTTGSAAGALGPNDAGNTTTANGAAGDADLTALSGVATHDASVLEFDFTPNADTVYFEYVFASEEYLEFVNSSFNDSFAFFVNGVNYALVDNAGVLEPITINNINPGKNAALYVDNPGTLNVEYDGLTTVLTFMAPVNTGVPNHIKLAIADGSDSILDSGVFLKAGSFSTTPPAGDAKVTGGGSIAQADGKVTLGTQVIRDDQGLRGNLQVNDHRTGTKFHGYSVNALSVTGSTAVWSGEGRLDGVDGYTFTATLEDNRNGNSAKKGPADTVHVVIKDGAGTTVWENTAVDLWGNVTVHDE